MERVNASSEETPAQENIFHGDFTDAVSAIRVC